MKRENYLIKHLMFKIIPTDKGYQIEINGRRLEDIFEKREWADRRLDLILRLFYGQKKT